MSSEFGAGYGMLPREPVIAAQVLLNLWGMVSIAGVAIYLVTQGAIGLLPRGFQNDRRDLLKALAGAAVVSPVAAVGFGTFVERTNFEVRQCEIAIRDLPRQLEGMRLVQLSDIHLGSFLSEKSLQRVIDQANELKPHLAFVTGDLISVEKDPLDECLRRLSLLRADLGTFGCLGNHEVYAKAEDYTAVQGKRLGIEFLRNEARILNVHGASLNIAGVDYQPFEQRRNYLRNAGGAQPAPGAVNLLLSHNPDVFPAAAAKGYDLMLAGHTHGGQITFEILSPALNPARMLTPFVRGLYRDGDASAYVTRGIGTLGVPARLGARPEISLLTLKRMA
jgi:predicted MPP superfamily phosphohydrolase